MPAVKKIKERTNKIIQNYAHDYRNMEMTQLELMDMLTDFLEEVQNADNAR